MTDTTNCPDCGTVEAGETCIRHTATDDLNPSDPDHRAEIERRGGFCTCDEPAVMPADPHVCNACGNLIHHVHTAAFSDELDDLAARLRNEPVDGVGVPIAPGVHDATATPGVERLPDVMTSMTPDTFKAWLGSDGDLFVVYLPGQRSFIIKVPFEHHAFFVAVMQQVRFALGDEVQAVRMTVVTGPPADADGTAQQAPGWAQPNPAAPPTKFGHDAPTTDEERGQRVDYCRGSHQRPAAYPATQGGEARGACPVCSREHRITDGGVVEAHPKPTMRDSDSHGF